MKVGIIGAGASGIMAAIEAAECGANAALFEKNDRVGQKILATGNGKCNLSNLDFSGDKYYCSDRKKLESMFSVFSVKDTITFFEKNGMMVKDKNGYLYPYSEQASTVLDVLRRILKERKTRIVTEAEITDVFFSNRKNCFVINSREGESSFDRLILSCGGPAGQKKREGLSGFQIAEEFGHSIKKPMPGLVQLRSKDSFIKGMAGVRLQAKLSLLAESEVIAEERGELQITDYGISGIPVFQFSREAGYALAEGKNVCVKANFFPDYDETEFTAMLHERFENRKEASLEEFLLGMLHKKINTALMKYMGWKPRQRIQDIGWMNIKKFISCFWNLVIHIDSANGMENAQVCAGGVDFGEVDMQLQSQKQKGLYLAGELLDVDGKCGGYNLQWAWTSGYIAGRNAAG